MKTAMIQTRVNAELRNEQTLKALSEADEMLKNSNTKKYSSFSEIVQEVQNEV